MTSETDADPFVIGDNRQAVFPTEGTEAVDTVLLDADVYLDPTGIDEDEQKAILKQLKKVARGLEAYCLKAEGWFKSPKFHFKFDKELDRVKRMDELFAQIEKELKS